jgi:hypothetical protein
MSFMSWLIKPYAARIKINVPLGPEEERRYDEWFGTGIKNVTFGRVLAWNQIKRFQRRGAFNEAGTYYFRLQLKDGRIHYELYKMGQKEECDGCKNSKEDVSKLQ